MSKDVKAVSTLWLILSILISLIVGGLVSYVWVMSSYYNMPENTTLLIVTDALFPATNARCFNVTILNPSNSVSDVNITAIHLSVEGKNEAYNVTVATPSLPFLLRRGTKVTFNCSKNWGSFAGEAVRIEPVAANVTTKSYLYTTPKVKWDITPNFDASKTVEYFDLTVENFESIINLTISEIKWFGLSINDVTPSLPYVLLPNHKETFRCYKNWADVLGENVTITVRTAEGYELKSTNKLLGAFLYVKEVKFDYADTTYFNVTINSSEDSAVTAVVSGINLTLQNGESFPINETREHILFKNLPPVFRSVPPNGSVIFACLWNWAYHRDEAFTVNVYTEQGFKVLPPAEQLRTPPEIVWNITDVKFDLSNTERFSVNVTNMPCSLYDINVTRIDFNSHKTNITSSIIAAGDPPKMFICEYNWTDSVGKNATIRVHVLYKGNESSSISYNLTLPYFKITEVSFSNFSLGNPYVNVTVYTSEFSTVNATITEILIEAENGTCLFNATITDGYELPKGMNVTIVCPWDWNVYSGQEITVRIRAADGSEVTKNVKVYPCIP